MMIEKIFVISMAIFFNLKNADACNGYTLKMNSIKNCDPDSIVQILPGFDVTMDNDCNLAYTGCVNIVKPIKTATGSYLIKKPPLPQLDGEVDYCQAISQGDEIPTIKQTLGAMGVPNKCPVAAKKYCADNTVKVSIGMFKSQMGLAAGSTTAKLMADHDSGKTCVEISLTVGKARKG